MIDTIELVEFSGKADCTCDFYKCVESFPKLNYTIKNGKTYSIISDFGCGSWGLANCLSGNGSILSGEVLVDGKRTRLGDLIRYSCIVSSTNIFGMKIKPKKDSTKKCIEKALKDNHTYSVSEIKKLFCLSDERFERPIAYISGEIWLASLAIGFSLQKDIFSFPWLGERDIGIFKTIKQLGIIDFLKKNRKIILVPSSQKGVLLNNCDASIVFKNRQVFFE